MKKWSAFIGLLCFVSLFLLGPYFASAQPARNPERVPRFLGGEFLNLTPEQKAKLEELRKAKQEERKAFVEQMQKYRTELRDLMKDPQANEKKINSLIDEMFKLRAAQMKNSIKHREQVRKVFTPEQLEKMRDLRAWRGAWIGPRMGMLGRRGGWGPGWRRPPFWEGRRLGRPLPPWWIW